MASPIVDLTFINVGTVSVHAVAEVSVITTAFSGSRLVDADSSRVASAVIQTFVDIGASRLAHSVPAVAFVASAISGSRHVLASGVGVTSAVIDQAFIHVGATVDADSRSRVSLVAGAGPRPDRVEAGAGLPSAVAVAGGVAFVDVGASVVADSVSFESGDASAVSVAGMVCASRAVGMTSAVGSAAFGDIEAAPIAGAAALIAAPANTISRPLGVDAICVFVTTAAIDETFVDVDAAVFPFANPGIALFAGAISRSPRVLTARVSVAAAVVEKALVDVPASLLSDPQAAEIVRAFARARAGRVGAVRVGTAAAVVGPAFVDVEAPRVADAVARITGRTVAINCSV